MNKVYACVLFATVYIWNFVTLKEGKLYLCYAFDFYLQKASFLLLASTIIIKYEVRKVPTFTLFIKLTGLLFFPRRSTMHGP